ncbi:MAG: hypothetical protein KDM63_16200 [Verrucomicrobiae bacterium]|nr:hypothetical protein [Verrucomicrobiae bacterium]MCB1088580.1 hypothetical protein [Verrucomicrobiae bacterium]
MSESRCPDDSPSDYFGLQKSLKSDLDSLLNSLPAKTRQAITELAQADSTTRSTVISQLDDQTATVLGNFITQLRASR